MMPALCQASGIMKLNHVELALRELAVFWFLFLVKGVCILPCIMYVLLSITQARSIRLVSEAAGEDEDSASEGLGELFLNGLSSENPYGARLSVDDQGRLSWPVLFLYPEYAQSDFISAFHEDSRYVLPQEPSAYASELPAVSAGQIDRFLVEEGREWF